MRNMSTIAQKDVQVDNRSSKAKKTKSVTTVKLEPGQVLQRVAGGYAIIAGRNAGPAQIELEPGEKLHKVPGGWIIQPAGNPGLSVKGVAKKIDRVEQLVLKIAKKGPLHLYPGFQGYIMDKRTGSGFIPKLEGMGNSGSDVMFYESDIDAWLDYMDEEDEVDEGLKDLEVPEGIFNLFKELGEEEQDKYGYVTKDRVLAEAREKTIYMDKEELAAIGLEKPISTGRKNYDFLRVTALKLGWGNNPHRAKNPQGAYRRKPRF